MIKRDEAFELLKKYNKDPFHIQHSLTVEAVMKWYAKELGYADDAEYWGIVGLLHDIDFELYPEEHCLKAPELLREGGVSEDIIHAVCSHGYGITVGCGVTIDVEPIHEMEKVLFAADELTGLVWAAALMRPSKSTKDMELKSLKKKYKSKGFAAGCSREVIERGAEQLGWELDKLLEMTLKAMAESEDMINEEMEALYKKKVAVFGIGGVGGYVCEALVRSGIGSFDLIDDDKVCLTNLNRQIIATRKTVGKYKAEVMKERMLEINPDVDVEIHKCFFLPENADEFPFHEYDYIVDAVDTVTAKIELILRAQKENIPIISAMGAGNKLDAGRLKVADIYDTRVCPLARVMRRELKKRNVKKLKVVYSDEQPIRPLEDMSISCRTHCICPPGAQHKCTERRDIPGSTAFVPAVAGLLIAGEIVNDLSRNEKTGE